MICSGRREQPSRSARASPHHRLRTLSGVTRCRIPERAGVLLSPGRHRNTGARLRAFRARRRATRRTRGQPGKEHRRGARPGDGHGSGSGRRRRAPRPGHRYTRAVRRRGPDGRRAGRAHAKGRVERPARVALVDRPGFAELLAGSEDRGPVPGGRPDTSIPHQLGRDADGDCSSANSEATRPAHLSATWLPSRRRGRADERDHHNVSPTIDVQASVDGADLGSVASRVQRLVNDARAKLPRGSTISLTGQAQTMSESFRGLAFGIILDARPARSRQSVARPAHHPHGAPRIAGRDRVDALRHRHDTEPPGPHGVAHDRIGVATANSILVVTFVTQAASRGQRRSAAALAAGSTRLRPVIMTATAMIIGMLPVAHRPGDGGEGCTCGIVNAVIGGAAFRHGLDAALRAGDVRAPSPQGAPRGHRDHRGHHAAAAGGGGERRHFKGHNRLLVVAGIVAAAGRGLRCRLVTRHFARVRAEHVATTEQAPRVPS